ncbi:hypothetical protein ABEB36_007545 [Hypothenemus hampei]|uniref:F-box domain-containing protein n=1 Tax=Hypothenemus hampei TaxID=57062 RepID=A0ABD1EUD1_HYPHA
MYYYENYGTGVTLQRCWPTIAIKGNPPQGVSNWLSQFIKWSNVERLMALNKLIARCEPTHALYDAIDRVPISKRLYIVVTKRISIKTVRHLLQAAQTCHSWRIPANFLWKKKCKEAGIEEISKTR